MAKMTDATKAKVREASSGLKKVTEEQAKAIKELWETKSPKFEDVKKLVHKSVLYKITGSMEFAPKANRNERAEMLNSLLFS